MNFKLICESAINIIFVKTLSFRHNSGKHSSGSRLVLYIFESGHRLNMVQMWFLILSLSGGPIGPPLFERPVAQKVMKLTKFGKINYSMEIILALKLSLGVSSKKAILYKCMVI